MTLSILKELASCQIGHSSDKTKKIMISPYRQYRTLIPVYDVKSIFHLNKG